MNPTRHEVPEQMRATWVRCTDTELAQRLQHWRAILTPLTANRPLTIQIVTLERPEELPAVLIRLDDPYDFLIVDPCLRGPAPPRPARSFLKTGRAGSRTG